MRPFAAAFLCLALAAGAAPAEAPAEGSTEEPAAGPVDRRALLVGINRYRSPTIGDLRGAVNDVANLRRLLVESFGFPDDDDHLRVLTDGEATRDAILAAFEEHLIAKARPGSIVVFHYSGHGSQRADASGDESDRMDETLVPHDSGREPDPNRDILDDELNALLARLAEKTPHVTFVFDSCHSGSAVRGAGLARTVAPDPRPPAAPGPGDAPAGGEAAARGAGALPYTLIAAAGDAEQARELAVGGEHHGALTWFLAEQIRRAGAGATYREVLDAAQARVTGRYPGQHPQLEGAERDRVVFGTESRPPAAFVAAAPAAGGRVELAAGQVHGATAGSLYDVYAPETRDFDAAEPVARVEVAAVEVIRSTARVVSGSRRVEPASRAVERRHAYPERPVGVHLMGRASSPALERVAEELARFDHLRPVDESAGYDLLVREEDGSLVIEAGDPSEISPRVPADEPGAALRVVDRLAQWAKWLGVLEIESPPSPLAVELEVEPLAAGTTRGAFRDRQVDVTLGVDEDYRLAVRNASDRPLYLSLLVLSDDGSVELLYPVAGASETVAPGKTIRLPDEDNTFYTFLPEGRSSVRDVLKLFATTRATDFSFLTQPAVRGAGAPAAPARTLEQLLARRALGANRAGATRGADEELWTVVDLVMEVRQR